MNTPSSHDRKTKKIILQCVTSVLLVVLSSHAWPVNKEDIRQYNTSLHGFHLAKVSSSWQAAGGGGSQADELRTTLGLSTTNGLSIKAVHVDTRGGTHTRYQQKYKGVPVYGEEIITHEKGFNSTHLTGAMITGFDQSNMATVADAPVNITMDDALEIAQQHAGHDPAIWTFKNTSSELVIFLQNDLTPKLCYSISYFAEHTNAALNSSGQTYTQQEEPTRPNFIIDTETGKILKQWEGLTNIEVGEGPGGNTKTGPYEFGVDFDHMDVTQVGTTCTMDNTHVKTVNLNHGTSGSTAYSYPCPRNTVKPINGAFSPLNDAHYFGGVVFNMFNDWLGVPPLTFQLVMRVHYSTNYENAFWDGSQMTFGDGASRFYPLVDINISAHEVSHGFTEQNSGLIYNRQSGGMNEAFSDMAGEAAEQYWRGSVDWFTGGDVMKVADGLRYFEDPTRDGRSISHADDYFDGLDVHYSSGVYNRAFFLISNTPGWTIQKAFEIFAHANMHYWVPNETFNNGACGVLESAHDLGYNSIQVDTAFQTVGVDCGYLPFVDNDGDGMDDNWELSYGLNPTDPTDGSGDLDGDGLSNFQEYTLGTAPDTIDSDGDTLGDYDEVNTHGTNPANADTDGDIMDDGYELLYSFDPLNPADGAEDFDGDGFSNAVEYEFSTDPTDSTSIPPVTVISFEDALVPADWTVPDDAHAGWQTDASTSQHGSFGLRSSTISHGQQAKIEFTTEFAANGLSFWSKTSTESCCDRLYVYVDNVLVLNRSGSQDWIEHPINISEGEHTIRFEYRKDGSVHTGLDTVWIDNIRIISADLDSDGMSDAWEDTYGLDKNDPSDAALDKDQDGLSNLQEYNFDTNPLLPDTDGDGLLDYAEIFSQGTDPNNADSDGDDLNDFSELVTYGTDPLKTDSENDGMPDGWEVTYGLNPLIINDRHDPDSDGWTNIQEYGAGTNPNNSLSIPGSSTSGGSRLALFYNASFIDTSREGPNLLAALESLGYEVTTFTGYTAADFATALDGAHLVIPELERGPLHAGLSEDAANVIREHVARGGGFFIAGDGSSNDISLLNHLFSYSILNGSCSSVATLNSAAAAGTPFADDPEILSSTNGTYCLSNTSLPTEALNIYQTFSSSSVAVLPYLSRKVTYLGYDWYQSASTPDWLEVWNSALEYGAAIADTDGDGMPDEWETANGLDLSDPSDAILDGDNDGLVNLQEYFNETDPANPDTDGDALIDGHEFLIHRTNPTNADTDADTLNDYDELFVHRTNPLNSDSDSDAMPDAWELTYGLDPLDPDDASIDTDSDTFSNLAEYLAGTDPTSSFSVPCTGG